MIAKQPAGENVAKRRAMAFRTSIRALSAVLVAGTSTSGAVAGGHAEIVPGPMPALSRHDIAEAVEAINPQPAGQILVVECHGNYDYETIQGAVDVASNGDTIMVLPNTCTPQGAYFENIDFLGKAITVQSLTPTDAAVVEATIINGSQSGSVVTFQSGEGSDSVLNGFTITDGSADKGGGIHCRASSPAIRNCVITANTAVNRGGGVYCASNSHPTLTGCTLSGNSSGNTGGGMDNREGSMPVVAHCAFNVNSASYGGGVQNRDAMPTFTNCSFSGNSVAVRGGAIRDVYSASTMTNCTFSGNSADDNGGGCFSFESSSMVTNCTFSGNMAASQGGGMYHRSHSVATIANCIFWGNSDSSGTGEFAQIHDVESSASVVTYNCVQGCATFCADPDDHNTSEDPLFADAAGGDLHLSPGSPCIDAGDNGSVPPDVADLDGDGNTAEPTPLDLDGHPRFADDPNTPDTGNGTPPIVDMGAYEFRIGPLVLLDIKPGSCPNPLNRSSHGVLPVALVGTVDFDVTTIDVSSVALARADGVGGSVAPNEAPPGPHSVFEDEATPFDGEPCDCHDLAGDGIDDLSMKFWTPDVVEVLQLNDLNNSNEVELVISGTLADGTDFTSARDCIVIVPPGTGTWTSRRARQACSSKLAHRTSTQTSVGSRTSPGGATSRAPRSR